MILVVAYGRLIFFPFTVLYGMIRIYVYAYIPVIRIVLAFAGNVFSRLYPLLNEADRYMRYPLIPVIFDQFSVIAVGVSFVL